MSSNSAKNVFLMVDITIAFFKKSMKLKALEFKHCILIITNTGPGS